MSLKGFHLIFITCSVILAFGLLGWGIQEFLTTSRGSFLLWAALGLISALSLVVYEYFFIRKTKNIQ